MGGTRGERQEAYQRAYYQAHKEALREKHRAWARANRARLTELARERRRRLRKPAGAPGPPRGAPSPRYPLGRPLVHGVRLIQRAVSLTPQQWERLRELGGGNASAGLRRLLDDRAPRDT
jgi:hypothetical protein